MLEVAGEQRETLSPEDVSKYPCNSLQVIDQMWYKYSSGKFSFGVQLKNYYEAG